MKFDNRDSALRGKRSSNIVKVSREFLLEFVLALNQRLKKKKRDERRKQRSKKLKKKKNEFATAMGRRIEKKKKKKKPNNTQRYQKCIMQ